MPKCLWAEHWTMGSSASAFLNCSHAWVNMEGCFRMDRILCMGRKRSLILQCDEDRWCTVDGSLEWTRLKKKKNYLTPISVLISELLSKHLWEFNMWCKVLLTPFNGFTVPFMLKETPWYSEIICCCFFSRLSSHFIWALVFTMLQTSEAEALPATTEAMLQGFCRQ